jgi:hypothetical protein
MEEEFFSVERNTRRFDKAADGGYRARLPERLVNGIATCQHDPQAGLFAGAGEIEFQPVAGDVGSGSRLATSVSGVLLDRQGLYAILFPGSVQR